MADALGLDRRQLTAYLDGSGDLAPLLGESKTELGAHADKAERSAIESVSPFIESALVAAFRSNTNVSLNAFKNAERVLLEIRRRGLESRLAGEEFSAAFCKHLLDAADGATTEDAFEVILKVGSRLIEADLAKAAGKDIAAYRRERANAARAKALAHDVAEYAPLLNELRHLVKTIRARPYVESQTGLKWQTIVDVARGQHCASDPEWIAVVREMPSLRRQQYQEDKYRTDPDFAEAVQRGFSPAQLEEMFGPDGDGDGDGDGASIPF